MSKLMNTLMLSCAKATELIDKQSVIKLSVREKMLLQFHTGMCDGCKAYRKQSRLLDKFLKAGLQGNEDDVPQLSNNKLKQQIISKL